MDAPAGIEYDWPYSSYWPKPPELGDLLSMSHWSEEASEQMTSGGHDAEYWEGYEAKVFESSARALAQLEKDGCFNPLPCTNGFRILLTGHDEPHIYSYLRFERFQKNGALLLPYSQLGVQIGNGNAELQKAIAKYNE